LVRSENGELDAQLREDFQCLRIDGGLGQPHAFRLAPEAGFEVDQPPADLGQLIAAVRERHDDVVVHLGQRGPMPRKAFAAGAVRLQNRPVKLRPLCLQPGKNRGAEVEAHVGVVVNDLYDAAVAVEDPGDGVGLVALHGDPLVPVVIRVGGILELDRLERGVLPRGLVEVPMNADVPLHRHPLFA
jgi:hypothetical protein